MYTAGGIGEAEMFYQGGSSLNSLFRRVCAALVLLLCAAAAHAVGNEAEADRFETEVREAEQRLARLRGLLDQREPPRNDYLS